MNPLEQLAHARRDRAHRWPRPGSSGRRGPTSLVRIGARAAALGARRPPPATRRLGDPPPRPTGARRRARHADLRRGPTAARTRSPTRWRDRGPRRGRRRRDPVPQPPRLRRRDASRCSKLGADALYLNTMFAGAADHRRLRARAAQGDRLRRGVRGARRRAPRRRRKRFVAWPDGRAAGPRTRCSRTSIAAGDPSDARAAGREGPRRHPHVAARPARRRARSRKQPDSLDPVAVAALEDPAPRARADDDRRADVPLVGLRALHARR